MRVNLNNLKLQNVGTGRYQPWAGGRAEVGCPCPGRWRWRKLRLHDTSPSQPERPHPPALRSPWTCCWWTWAAPSLSPHSLERKSGGQEKLTKKTKLLIGLVQNWRSEQEICSHRQEKNSTNCHLSYLTSISNSFHTIFSDNLCDLVWLCPRQIAQESYISKARRLK